MIKEQVLVQGNEDQLLDEECIVLIVHHQGRDPIELAVPSHFTGYSAAQFVARELGINPEVWPGIGLISITGDRIPPLDPIDRWNGFHVRLGATHTSMMSGK